MRATLVAVAVVALAQVAVLPFAVNDSSSSHGTGWIGHIALPVRISTTIVNWGASNLYRRTTTLEGLLVGAVVAALVGLLLVFGADRQTRWGALVAAAVAAFVFIAPLVLGAVGFDYFLSRNEIPAFVPCALVLAAACLAPRARLAGGVLAVVLLAVFALTAINVQTHPYLQRPNWRGLAQAIGPASVTRAVLVDNGTTADALKIYLPGVHWTQPLRRRTLISEVDVIGARKKLRLAPDQTPTGAATLSARPLVGGIGHALPLRVAAPGTRLVAHFRFKSWVVARFALVRPERISNGRLAVIARRFFTHSPSTLLIFVQRPVHLTRG
jgi:hypothetical protein